MLIPNRLAVYDFPGLRDRLFPEFDDSLVKSKSVEYGWSRYKKNLSKNTLTFIMEPSMVNDKIMREEVTLDRLSGLLKDKYNIVVSPNDISIEDKLIYFGYSIITLKYATNINYSSSMSLVDYEIEILFVPPQLVSNENDNYRNKRNSKSKKKSN